MRRLLFLLCLLFSLHAAAAEACGEYTVAFYEHGVLYYREGGDWKGIDKDVVDELGKRSGCRFKPVLESSARIWAGVASGTLAMSVSGIPTPERERFAQFAKYFVTRNYMVLLRDLPAKDATPEQFLASGKRLGVVHGYRHTAPFDAWIARMRAAGQVYEAADFPSLVHLFEIGRIDGFPTSALNGDLVRKFRLQRAVQVRDWYPRERTPVGLILSRKRVPDNDVQRMRSTLEAMRTDGTLETIYRRYVSPEMAHDMLQF